MYRFVTKKLNACFFSLNKFSNLNLAQHYPEGELNKAESVCVDRCSAKFMEMHDKIGQVIQEWSAKNEALLKAQQGPLPM